MRSQTLAVVLLTSASFALSSCTWLRRPKAQAAPPVIAAPPSNPPQPAETPQLPPPPKVDQSRTTQAKPPTAPSEIPAKPPKTQKPPLRAGRRPQAPKTAPQPVPAAQQASSEQPAPADPAAPASEQVPQLAPLLSASDQEAYGRAIDAALQRTETNLASLAGRHLNTTQRSNVDRTRSFVAQAQQLRATDVLTAKGFADRADTLAQALAEEVRRR